MDILEPIDDDDLIPDPEIVIEYDVETSEQKGMRVDANIRPFFWFPVPDSFLTRDVFQHEASNQNSTLAFKQVYSTFYC